MALHWFSDAFNPTFDDFRAWMRNSPDGEPDDLYDDALGGCQDFDLMVDLSTVEFEQLLLDPTETITTAARQFVADLLEQRAETRGGLELSKKELQRWVGDELADEEDEALVTQLGAQLPRLLALERVR